MGSDQCRLVLVPVKDDQNPYVLTYLGAVHTLGFSNQVEIVTGEKEGFASSHVYDPALPARGLGELTVERYIDERLNDQLRYYDRTATRAKRRYLQSRCVSVVAAALVPVLVNLEFAYVDYVTTVFSVVVVLLVSLEGVFHFREQWVNSRSTSEALRKEYFQLTSSEGRYADFVEDRDGAFRLFVGRVEAIIETENLSTLQVMTRESRQDQNEFVSSLSAPRSENPNDRDG